MTPVAQPFCPCTSASNTNRLQNHFDTHQPAFCTHTVFVKLKPETESRLQQLAATTGREPAELVEHAMAGYLAELSEVRTTLDTRYGQIKSGAVKPLSGEEAFVPFESKSKDRRPKRAALPFIPQPSAISTKYGSSSR